MGRRVVLMDCRGHGASGKPHDAAAYGGERQARDVVAVLDALKVESADLMGYSMGGLIALATALRFPERVRALVVMGAHPFAQDMQAYRHAVGGDIGRWLATIEAQGIELSSDTRRRIRANDMRALRACTARDRPDTSAALAALRAPLLAIAGTKDPIFAAVKAFAERAGGRFVALEDRNHVTAFVDVDAVAAAVDEYLRMADPCPPGQGG
jgi:pimeloyl-ACP methyl ester carboxylesterase